MKVSLTGSGKIVAVCSRCDAPIRDGEPAHRFEPAQPGRRVLCEECHEAWKAKLQRVLEVLSAFPEQVVDGFIAMAAGTRLAEQLESDGPEPEITPPLRDVT